LGVNTDYILGIGKSQGKVRILLITKKMAEPSNIPTITDLGYKQELLSAWFALYAPAGIPEEVKRVLVPAVEKAVKDPGVKAKIEKIDGQVHKDEKYLFTPKKIATSACPAFP
jgi:tripartite-type tricarboxylate transporter receptor subunit TctC